MYLPVIHVVVLESITWKLVFISYRINVKLEVLFQLQYLYA